MDLITLVLPVESWPVLLRRVLPLELLGPE
jgi:hypothetical protein